jgi:hypothetical protein
MEVVGFIVSQDCKSSEAWFVVSQDCKSCEAGEFKEIKQLKNK